MLRAVAAALLALAAAAAAHPEADAPSLHPDVVRAWHEPEPVAAGQQWRGYLQLRPGHGAANVSYQVCNVADGVCFSFPHPARDAGNGTYAFDTADYLANGRPVDWEAGWEVGVRWFLAGAGPAGNGTWVPPQDGPAIASHYLTFHIPGGGRNGAPGWEAGALALAVLACAALRGRP